MKTNDKIAIIGPYPPPYGGISVHVQRVLQYLSENQYVFFNSSKTRFEGDVSFYGKIKYIKVWIFLFKRFKLIHAHTTDPFLRVLLGLIGQFRKNIYLHAQGASLTDYMNKTGIIAFSLRKLVRNFHIIASNSSIAAEIQKYQPLSICEIDAFLPPKFDLSVFHSVINKYRDFFRPNRFIVSITGWFNDYLGEDLYGFDIAIRVIERINKEGNEIYMAVSVNGINHTKLFKSFINYIKEHDLQERVLIIREELKEIWPVFMASQLFIRPTNTDGSAISIKEALWFNTPVITSDCVPRPKGVVLFKNRSVDDLYGKISDIYHQPILSITEKIKKMSGKTYNYKLFEEIYELSG